MPDLFSATKSWFPGRIRFSIGGLLVFITGVAIYLAVRNLHNTQNVSSVQGSNPWKGVATFLFAIGIAQQVRDLERTRRTADRMFHARLRWEQAWRILAAAGLVVLLVEILLRHSQHQWFISKDMQLHLDRYPLVAWFLLLFLVLQIPRAAAERYNAWRSRGLGIAALLVGFALLLLGIHDRALVSGLVYIAIRGVEISQSYRRGELLFYDYQFFTKEHQLLQCGAVLAAGGWLAVLVMGWLSLHVRSRRWRPGLRWTAIGGLLGLVPLAIWGRGLMISVQPFYLSHPDVARPYVWLNGLALFCLVTASTTAVLLRDAAKPVVADGICWRGPFGSYWHEQWLGLIVLGMATLGPVAAFLKETWELPSKDEFAFTMWAATFLYDLDFVFGAFTLTWIIAGFWQTFRFDQWRNFPPLDSELPWRSAVGTAAFVAVLLAVGMQIGYWLAWVLIVEPYWL